MPQPDRLPYTVLPSQGAVATLAGWLAGVSAVAVDIETTALSPRHGRMRLLQIAADTKSGPHCWIVNCDRLDPSPLIAALGDIHLIAHSAKFELSFLVPLGYTPGRLTDTMLLSTILHGHKGPLAPDDTPDEDILDEDEAGEHWQRRGHALADVVKRELHRDLSKELQVSDWRGPLTNAQYEYAAEDALVTLQVERVLRRRILAAGLAETAALEARVLPMIAWMEANGVPIDAREMQHLADTAAREMARLLPILDAIVPDAPRPAFDWTVQRAVLGVFAALGVGGPSGSMPDTKTETLQRCAHPLAVLALRYKALPAKSDGRAAVAREMDAYLPDALRPRINWNSPPQVVAAFVSLGIPLDSSSRVALLAVEHPLVALLLAYKKHSTLRKMFGEKWLERIENGRIHPSFWQCGTDTGRFSSSRPNMQQLPKRKEGAVYRRCVKAPEGRVIVACDYSNIELRVLAWHTADRALRAAFAGNRDIHRMTAATFYGKAEADVTGDERDFAKIIGFGFTFGMGAETFRRHVLSSSERLISLDEAQAAQHAYRETWPGVYRWQMECGKERAITTRTAIGRRRIVAPAWHCARLNAPIQGTAADMMKMALARLYEERDRFPTALPIAAVHDEIVYECDEVNASAVMAWMIAAMKETGAPVIAPVPVEVEGHCGPTWAEDKEE